MKTNSKNIGNAYEREFSYKLSEWITGDKNSDVCYRDLSSGARNTVRTKQGKQTAHKGDIVCTDLQYADFFKKYYIDTKSYKAFNPIMINPKNMKTNKIFQQWVKTVDESLDMIPVMPCKIRDHVTPEFILFPNNLPVDAPFRIPFIHGSKIFYDFFDMEKYNCFIVLQEEFFRLNKYEDFLEKVKENI